MTTPVPNYLIAYKAQEKLIRLVSKFPLHFHTNHGVMILQEALALVINLVRYSNKLRRSEKGACKKQITYATHKLTFLLRQSRDMRLISTNEFSEVVSELESIRISLTGNTSQSLKSNVNYKDTDNLSGLLSVSSGNDI